MAGYGREEHEDGRVYIGEFKSGKKHGTGTMTYEKEKKQYTGPWENNLKHGIGIELNLKGNTRRVGEWKKGKWMRWLSNTQRIEELVREKMLQSSNLADLTMDVKIHGGVVHELEAVEKLMLEQIRRD
jgi:hypothetical protein